MDKRTGLTVIAMLLSGALRADPAPAADPAAAAPSAEAIIDETSYIYNGTSRDPFIPLAGGPALAMSSGGATEDIDPSAFNPSSMELKGILRTKTGRWAMMTGSAGERYVVENGKIRDGKKRPIEGYVGIIKEKTLVLIGPNNQVTELKLKRDQDSEGKP